MNNADQPINPQNYTRCGEGDDDFQPLIDGKNTGYEKKMAGLTKREYASMLAMQGLIASYDWNVSRLDNKLIIATAENAVKLADELLKQLEK